MGAPVARVVAVTALVVVLGASAARTLAGCEQGCDSARPCLPNAISVSSYGTCVSNVTSDCFVLGLVPYDSGRTCTWDSVKVYPTSDSGTCDISASFSDGTQSTVKVKFTVLPDDPCCPGTQYSFDPFGIEVFAVDAGHDAADAADGADADGALD